MLSNIPFNNQQPDCPSGGQNPAHTSENIPLSLDIPRPKPVFRKQNLGFCRMGLRRDKIRLLLKLGVGSWRGNKKGYCQAKKPRYASSLSFDLNSTASISTFQKIMIPNFKSLLAISKLIIELPADRWSGRPVAESTVPVLKYFTNLSDLKLTLTGDLRRWSYLYEDEKTPDVLSCLNYFPALTSLEVTISHCSKSISRRSINALAHAITRLKFLRNFGLELSNVQHADALEITNLCESIRHLTELSRLKLSIISQSPATTEIFKQLSLSLCEFDQLEVLKVELPGGKPQVSQEEAMNYHNTVKQMVASGIEKNVWMEHHQKRHNYMQEMEIFGDSRKSVEECLQDFFAAIFNLQRLSVFQLSLPDSRMLDDSSLNLLSEALKNIPLISDLKLDFSKSIRITAAGIECLSETFPHLHSLRSFDLNLAKCSIPLGTTMGCVAANLIDLPHLSILKLNLAADTAVNSENIGLFSMYLNQLTKLSSLSLDLSSCKQLDDECNNHLASALGSLSSLSRLSLKLTWGSGVTDKSVEDLSGALKDLSNLADAELMFDAEKNNSGGISDQGYQALSENVRRMPALCKLNLEFRNCNKTTASGMKNVTEELKQIRSVRLDNPHIDRRGRR